MEEELEIILQAVDEASGTFESVSDSVSDMAASFEDVSGSSSEASEGMDEVADSGEGASESMDSMTAAADAFTATALLDFAQQVSDTLWNLADSAGTVQDSMDRASLEAEGFGLSASDMKGVLSDVADETGRAGGQIRESFIKATARGVTDMDAFKQMMEGAGAQAYLLGTDIESMGNKFSSMAQKDTLMTRALAETGITMDELATAMGMTGATADEVKEKWKSLDTNQRAALLGTAASMNEAEDANDHYKNSWEGLQAQVDKAKAKLEVMVGNVLLPVLVPALQVAARVLDWFGGVLGAVMDGPLSGVVSVIGAVAAGIAIAVPVIAALTAAWGFFTATIWPAVAASWALLAPWLPWIALGAAIVLVIYEIGKAFGWWTDASSMIDAIGAGLQRLWNAFINHPDVQATIQAISDAWNWLSNAIGEAWNAVSEFFNLNTDGSFDIVRALIDGIGQAWDAVTLPLRTIITVVQAVIDIFNLFVTGQMTLPQAIMLVLTTLYTLFTTYFGMIINGVVTWGSQMLSNGVNAASNFVKGIITRVTQLPGKIATHLNNVKNKIISIGQQWVSNAKTKAQAIVDGVYSALSGLPGRISSALSGVISAITAPFTSAYNTVVGIVDNIKSKVNEGMDYIGQLNPFAGGDFAGGIDYTYAGGNETLDVNYNISLDLTNVPAGMSSGELITALTDKSVLAALTGNRDFQELDAKVKSRIASKQTRARGV